MTPQTHTQSGFSMVEVLVALVVLSVGLLGMAGLYVTTLRSGSGSISRMQAVYLAADMADRIRANRTAGATFAAGVASTAVVCNATTVCTPAQMAADDLLVWNTQITQQLPGGTGAIGLTAPTAPALPAAPSTYTITVSWNDPGTTATQTYQLVTQI
jgi:type IV pilus assembly protein PilV